MTAVLHEVTAGRDRARQIRRILGRTIKQHLEGGEIAGFALVSWGPRGEGRSGYYAETGPIAMSLVPTYAHDCLNRHIAVDLAQSTASNLVTGD